MKILFAADVHIKLGQKSVPVPWAKNRYELLIQQLVEYQKQADLFVIGGDIFDRLATLEELEVYYDLVSRCTIPTLIYPGNHESIKKDTTFFTYLKNITNRLNSKVTVIDDYYSTNEFDIIPYNRLKEFKPEDFNNNLLLTHVRGAIEPHVKPEIDLSLLDRWQTVLAGDLHSYENSQRNILYPGSPVTTSFHRSVVDTGVILFDTSNHTHEWLKFNLPQLIRKTIKAGDDMVATDYHHTIYEVEGDLAELGAMADSDLVDKKLLKRETDTALILDPTMTMQDELREYMLYILMLDEDRVEKVLQTYNNTKEKLA